MTTEPITMPNADASELIFFAVGTGFDGYAVAAGEHVEDGRWYATHRLVIRRDADGQHFAAFYRVGLTEQQDIDTFDSDPVKFEPVTVRKRMVEVTEYVTEDETAEATR